MNKLLGNFDGKTLRTFDHVFTVKHVIEIYVTFTTNVESDVPSHGCKSHFLHSAMTLSTKSGYTLTRPNCVM